MLQLVYEREHKYGNSERGANKCNFRKQTVPKCVKARAEGWEDNAPLYDSGTLSR